MLWTWFFTVARSIERRRAICLFDRPSAIRPAISRCRGVSASPPVTRGPPDGESRNALRKHGREAWRALQLPVRRCLDRYDQVGEWLVGGDVAGNPGLEQRDHRVLVVGNADRDDPGVRERPRQGTHAIRHGDRGGVDDDDPRFEHPGGHSGHVARSASGELDAILVHERSRERLAVEPDIADEEHADRRLRAVHLPRRAAVHDRGLTPGCGHPPQRGCAVCTLVPLSG